MRAWFDTEVAEKIGFHEAVLLNYIAYWCWKNQDDDNHVKDGLVWMYVTFSDLYKIFGYIGKRTLQQTIYNLQKNGYIMIRHNAGGMNRTNWYTLTEEGKELVNMNEIVEKSPLRKNCEMHDAKSAKPLRKNCEMHFAKNDFPSNYTKKDTTKKDTKKNARAKLAPPFDNPPQELFEAWEGFIEMRKSKRNTPTEKAVKIIANKLERLAPGNDLMKADILNQSTERGWQSVFPLKTDYQRKEARPYNAQTSAEEMYQEGLEIMKRSGMI